MPFCRVVGSVRVVQNGGSPHPRATLHVAAEIQESIDQEVCRGGVVLSATPHAGRLRYSDPNAAGDLQIPEDMDYRVACPDGTVHGFTVGYYATPSP